MTTDASVAADLATRAGELLLRLRSRMGFGEPDSLRDAGDQHSHEFLVAELERLRPEDVVLSEEGADDRARLDADRVWIVDPLDGTREFGEEGRTDWAVHVALAIDGRIEAAAVALPARGITLNASPPATLAPPHDGPPRVVVSRTRPPAIAETLAEHL